jgi:hypothetical protein
MKALHELTQEEYIKHLEDCLIDGEGYQRCDHCKRVDHPLEMATHEEPYDFGWVCDTCLLAWERAENRAQEIAASDEKDYRAAKGNR